jgi:type IV pilus assembly protein PilE
MAQAMERRYTASMSYATPADLPALACTNEDGMPARYAFSFSAAPTATTFALRAVPQGGQAANDAACGTLGVNEIGTRTVSGGAPVNQCW